MKINIMPICDRRSNCTFVNVGIGRIRSAIEGRVLRCRVDEQEEPVNISIDRCI